ncbi:MAG: hypothetical protein KBT32_09325 [Bacteroidales bacterium]|nr:hypothetical protein [Candidatus Physcocola equi]
MPNFVLIAKQNLYLDSGKVVTKGTPYEVSVSKKEVNANNVLLYKDTRESIMRQLSFKDVDLVSTRKEYYLNRAHFQVQERKNVLTNRGY